MLANEIKEEIEEIPYPQSFCVYTLTDENKKILYVGKSEGRSIGRISAHAYVKEFERVFYFKCKDKKTMLRREAELIIAAQPKYNKRIDDPSVIGMMTMTELKRSGYRIGEVLKMINNNKLATASIGTNTYFDKNVLNFL